MGEATQRGDRANQWARSPTKGRWSLGEPRAQEMAWSATVWTAGPRRSGKCLPQFLNLVVFRFLPRVLLLRISFRVTKGTIGYFHALVWLFHNFGGHSFRVGRGLTGSVHSVAWLP